MKPLLLAHGSMLINSICNGIDDNLQTSISHEYRRYFLTVQSTSLPQRTVQGAFATFAASSVHVQLTTNRSNVCYFRCCVQLVVQRQKTEV